MNLSVESSIQEILKQPLKICILNVDYSNSHSILKGTDPPSDPRHYLPKNLPWEWHMMLIDKANARSQIQQSRKHKFDLYMNFCDGMPDEDRVGVEVINALEHYNLPYTGCNAKFYSLTKQHMKFICTSSDINTPRYCFVHSESDIDLAINHIGKYPMFVKHYNGYSSIGLTLKNKVSNEAELREQVIIMIDEYGGALVEEFIEGEEYTVLVFENPEDGDEPIVLNPIQFTFNDEDTFKHFELKNIMYKNMNTQLVTNENLRQKLMNMAKKSFTYMFGSGFGRLDIRVNDKGELFFLEINAMAKMFFPPDEMGSADFILKNENTYTAEKMIYHMIHQGFLAHTKKQLPYHVFFRDVHGGLGIFAKKDIKEGEVIMTEEEKPKYLISKHFSEKAYSGVKKIWFDNYAYPISDQIYAIWSDNPSDWSPINHSCEPNMWYNNGELVVYAARNIKKNEELTMDYCTFLIDVNLTFDCACGEKACRKKFTGKDYLKKELIDKYKGHFSFYVEEKIEAILCDNK